MPNPDKLAAIAALRDALRCAQSALELIDGADDDKLRELAGSPVLLPTIRQGADIAGISRSAMYRLIDAGQMPTVEIAGVSGKRIKRSDLERFIDQLPVSRSSRTKKRPSGSGRGRPPDQAAGGRA